MTNDICESLIYSWLKHIKECQVVETNWKKSKNWNCNNAESCQIYDEFCKIFNIENADYSKFMNQGECDVIGIKSKDNKVNIICAEVAYHGKQLNYGGSSTEDADKVIKKFLFNTLNVIENFDVEYAEFYFITNKIGDTLYKNIDENLKKLIQLIRTHKPNYKYEIMHEDKFKSIVIDVDKIKSDINDSNESFARAMQIFSSTDFIK